MNMQNGDGGVRRQRTRPRLDVRERGGGGGAGESELLADALGGLGEGRAGELDELSSEEFLADVEVIFHH